MTHVAATSANSDVDKNLYRGLASYAQEMNPDLFGLAGQSWRGNSGATVVGLPRTLAGTGFGNKAWKDQASKIALAREAGDLAAAVELGLIGRGSAQKLRSFEQNLRGNAWPATIDRHAKRALTGMLDAGSPEDSEYLAMAEYLARLSRAYGLTPSAGQGALWTGASALTNVTDHRPVAQMFDNVLTQARSAVPATEISDADLLEQIIRGERVVYPAGYER